MGDVVGMDGNVVEIGCDSWAEVPVSAVLQGALGAELRNVLVIGQYENGDLFVAASDGSKGGPFYLLERAKAELLQAMINREA